MIDSRFRLALFASASLIAGLPAAAQTAAADAAVTNDAEIIVSARRRDERLIDVPVAVTAFNQADLQKYQAVDLSGLQAAAPNLNLVQGRGSAASANIFTGARVLVPAAPYGAYDFKASTSFRSDEGQRLDHYGLNLTANWSLSDTITLSVAPTAWPI